MSVELRQTEGGKVLEMTLSGKLHTDDYKAFVPEVDRLIKDHGKIRILCHLKDFHGWTLGAMWEDMKFDVRHFAHIERLALVGDKRWEAGMAVFCKPFTTAKVKYFDVADLTSAKEWIHEVSEPAASSAAK